MNFFTRKIFNSGDHFFALDLGDLSIRVLELDRNGKNDKIKSFGYAAVPAGLIEDGRVMDKGKVAQIIAGAIKKSGPGRISTKKVVCSLPESKAFLRIINIPKVSEEEAYEAIKWELEANIPLTSDQIYFDWQFLEEKEGKQRVLTIAVSREVVDEITETLSMAGLDVYGLELESVSSTRSLIDADAKREDISIIVDIGSKKTSFIISEGSVPCFTSSVPFSSQAITEIICGKMSISREEAGRMAANAGIEYSLENSAVFSVVKPLLESLAAEIEKTADFYQTISKESQAVSRVILCGSGANLKGIIPYLAARLSREIMVGDPWTNLDFGNRLPIIDRENSVCFVTAVGLALKDINYGN